LAVIAVVLGALPPESERTPGAHESSISRRFPKKIDGAKKGRGTAGREEHDLATLGALLDQASLMKPFGVL
jgi:hypothetical protein